METILLLYCTLKFIFYYIVNFRDENCWQNDRRSCDNHKNDDVKLRDVSIKLNSHRTVRT